MREKVSTLINARKSISACAAALGITAGIAIFLPATASAAPYAGQCGSGFNVIDKIDLRGGTVFLTYDGKRTAWSPCATTRGTRFRWAPRCGSRRITPR